MFGNFKISHVAQNILPLTKSQSYSGDEIKSKKGERKEQKKGKKGTLQVFDHRQQQNSDVFRSDTLQSTKTEMFFKT